MYWYAPWVFWGRQCAFVFRIYVQKYHNYTIDSWIMVFTVCASAIISPLRQWLNSYAKSRLKMCHTFKQFIHMQDCFLLTNLVIVVVHRVSTGVLYEPRQCSFFFWSIFPNLNFVLRQSVPRVRSMFNPTNTEVAQLSNNDARWVLLHSSRWGATMWLWIREMISIHQRSAATNEDKTTQIYGYSRTVSWMVSLDGFIMFGIMFMTATGLENSLQAFDVYTVSQSPSVVTSAENPAPEKSPQSIEELRNGHVANLQELLYQWRDIKFWLMC